MAAPTTETTNLQASNIISNGFKLTYSVGNGARRLVSVTENGTPMYPIDGEKYDASLKFKSGDQLISPVSGSGSCYPYPEPYPDPIEATMSSTASTTWVVYDGLSDGVTGLDIINLKPQTEYKVMVFEHNNYCYIPSDILSVITGFSPNNRPIVVSVYDNRTKIPIQNANVAIKDRSGFISDFGDTDEKGIYKSNSVEEGRYEVSIVASNYDSKILTGVFVQRQEPRRDNNYRIFTSAGNTEFGNSVIRRGIENKNEYVIYLDPINTARSFSTYKANDNPSRLTKL
jgi:hypothetical protein